MESVYFYALFANLCFSASTLIFTEYTHKTSVQWVNKFKVVVSVLCCFLVVTFFLGWQVPSVESIIWFLISGCVGLTLGDYFMLNAFKLIGPARTLLLYGFTPLIVGTFSYFLFGQEVGLKKLFAIIFLLGCLFTFVYEKFKQSGRWELKGFLFALTFVCLDAVALIMTRFAFDLAPGINPIEGHFYRSMGSVLGFWMIAFFAPIHFIPKFMNLTNRQKLIIFTGSFFGTFLSLASYFKAIQTGHLATVTSISVTSPFFASLFECLWHKKMPSRFLVLAFIQFLIGFYILVYV